MTNEAGVSNTHHPYEEIQDDMEKNPFEKLLVNRLAEKYTY